MHMPPKITGFMLEWFRKNYVEIIISEHPWDFVSVKHIGHIVSHSIHIEGIF